MTVIRTAETLYANCLQGLRPSSKLQHPLLEVALSIDKGWKELCDEWSTPPPPGPCLWYLQCREVFIGDTIRWVSKDGGSCCDVREAATFTEAEAFARWNNGWTEKPWPKGYIDRRCAPEHEVDSKKVDWTFAQVTWGYAGK